ncbi:MAG TPA: VTC domain-containing protein [Prevotella sp.]|nr:VTC domain-containing protein [Prevotella sp.]
MIDILSHYAPITLDEMSGIRLMNRTDTKFVTTKPMLRQLLLLAQDDYRVQDIQGERISPYYTVYFDTPDCAMYRRHETGHANRQKLRIRSYVNSGLNFLEVKTKNNHGRTHKKRINMHGFDPRCPRHDIMFTPQDEASQAYDDFLATNLGYDPTLLTEKVENHFNRVTLVNKLKTERLTIDFDLQFDNIVTGRHQDMAGIVIVELKRDGLQPSPILKSLMQLGIKPMGFSKYLIGAALTDDSLRRNRIKPRLRKIEKMMAQ